MQYQDPESEDQFDFLKREKFVLQEASQGVEVPEDVITALCDLRDSGLVNMFNRTKAIHILNRWGRDQAVVWLQDNPKQYVEALTALGNSKD